MMLFDTLDTKEKAQRFRKKRLKRINKGKVCGSLCKTPFCVLHLLPVSKELLFKSDVLNPAEFSKFIKISGKTSETLNLDGVRFSAIDFSKEDGKRFSWNAQMFHLGALEMVFVLPLYEKEGHGITKQIYQKTLTENLWNVMDGFKECMSSFNIDVPVVVGISFFNVLGYSFFTPPHTEFYSDAFDSHPNSDREKIILPAALITKLENMQEGERSIFDMLWRSFGLLKCYYYDEDGKRKNPNK